MRFKIYYIPTEDYTIVSGDTLEEIQEKVKRETSKRGWNNKDCYSEEI
jgi:hypothetical protein